MQLDPPEPATTTAPIGAANVESEGPKPTEVEFDSQNPQSLPSPPPEMHAVEEGERGATTGHVQETGDSPLPAAAHAPNDLRPHEDAAVMIVPSHQPLTAVSKATTKRRAGVRPLDEDHHRPQTIQERKKLRHNQERRMRKSEKKFRAASIAPKTETREADADDEDDDEYYWDHAEQDFPAALLLEDAGQQQAPETEVHPPTPKHDEPQAPSVARPAEEPEDPIASLRAGCVTDTVSIVGIVLSCYVLSSNLT